LPARGGWVGAGDERDDCERGPYTSYSACGIPYYLGGVVEDSDRLIARSPEEFRSAGIDVRTGCEAVGLDLAARTVTVRDHESARESSEGFDRLVVATGAEAVAPPVPGADAVEPVRTIDAAERFAARLDRERAGAAVVIGASYLGLEMAEALVQRGLEVTLVDQADQVMGTLDADMAHHVQQAAEGVGVKVLLSWEVQEIRVDPERAGGSVLTSEGELPADEIVLSTGVRPAIAVMAEAGLAVGESAALAVDDHQRCPGHDGVLAAGDYAESRDGYPVGSFSARSRRSSTKNAPSAPATVAKTTTPHAKPTSITRWAPKLAGTGAPCPATTTATDHSTASAKEPNTGLGASRSKR